MVMRATGTSSAPGTVTWRMYLVATPSSFSSATQACASVLVTAAFQRACTMPMRRSRPSISVSGPLSASCMACPPLTLGARGRHEAGDFEPVAGHAGHAARAAEQLHLRDAELAQDLCADTIG